MMSCFLHFKILRSYTLTCRHIQQIYKLAYENEDKKVLYSSFLIWRHRLKLHFCWYIGHWNYTHTIRKPKVQGQVIEVKTQLSHRDYLNLLPQKDETHYSVHKKRRCFIHHNQYYQLDIYCKPCHKRYKTINFKNKYVLGLDIVYYLLWLILN